MIDANESMTKTNSGISNLISLTQLCNPIFMLHGEHKEPNTYIRGSDRIDYILCTPKLLRCILRCGILSFDMATTAHHRGEYFDIRLCNSYMITHKNTKNQYSVAYIQHLPKV